MNRSLGKLFFVDYLHKINSEHVPQYLEVG